MNLPRNNKSVTNSSSYVHKIWWPLHKFAQVAYRTNISNNQMVGFITDSNKIKVFRILANPWDGKAVQEHSMNKKLRPFTFKTNKFPLEGGEVTNLPEPLKPPVELACKLISTYPNKKIWDWFAPQIVIPQPMPIRKQVPLRSLPQIAHAQRVRITPHSTNQLRYAESLLPQNKISTVLVALRSQQHQWVPSRIISRPITTNIISQLDIPNRKFNTNSNNNT